MSEFGSDGPSTSLRGFFFDVLALGGRSLIDEPLDVRRTELSSMHGLAVVPSLVTADLAAAQAFTDDALAAGHEGVVIKDLHATYDAGRRGAAWRKVKPVRTLDLVVLAAEWGHGRRTGWLSNLHLGARGAPGELVMVGKTFKGLTDALLTWQTEQLLAREIGRDGIVVHVRPELVVEIALDGVQVSRRYPGGVALRFARVKRYREDKSAADADAIETVQALL
jgi:DNA ligase 1